MLRSSEYWRFVSLFVPCTHGTHGTHVRAEACTVYNVLGPSVPSFVVLAMIFLSGLPQALPYNAFVSSSYFLHVTVVLWNHRISLSCIEEKDPEWNFDCRIFFTGLLDRNVGHSGLYITS